MASDEVVILQVDASKKSDGDCLCTGENKAATRLRKERKEKTSAPEVSIVSVENSKSKRKKLKCSSNKHVTLLLSSEDEDQIEMMEVDSKAGSTSNSSTKAQTDSLSSHSRPSTSSSSSSSSSSSVGKRRAGTSKTSADDDASTSSGLNNKQQLESDYLAALRLDQALNSKPLGNSDKNGVVVSDAALAKSLQEKEYGILNPRRDVSIVMESRVVMPGPSSPPSTSNTLTSPPTIVHPNEVIPTPLKVTESQQKVNPLLRKHPTCWTECPNCPSDAVRKYHLIDVMRGSAEWDVVALPVTQAGFLVTRVKRIQNEALWQRLCFEKQLMLRERADVNEKFLYHSSRSQVSVICEEGLDQRLSRSMGNFGSGIYFSDDPAKCNQYGLLSTSAGCKTMFCCRVLLGHTKIYPMGVSDNSLVREPLKEHPLPGEPKAYDSVQGNLSGQNEFIVYNMYRVMPEYVIEYTGTGSQHDAIYNHFSKLVKAARKKTTTTKRRRKKY